MFKVLPKHEKLILGFKDGRVSVYDLKTRQVKYSVPKAHSGDIYGLEFTPDEKHIITGGADRKYKIFEYDEGTDELILIKESKEFVDSILDLSMYPDGSCFVVGVKGGIMQVTGF